MFESIDGGVTEYGIDKNEVRADLTDYKFYCFHGIPQYCQVICNRKTSETIDFFDMEWLHQKFTGLGPPNRPFPHSSHDIPVPMNFDVMKNVAKRLSSGIPFVRIDFYEIEGCMYIGEITFYPFGGLGVFYPEEWNYRMGDLLEINTKR